jgi:hypothetical protein
MRLPPMVRLRVKKLQGIEVIQPLKLMARLGIKRGKARGILRAFKRFKRQLSDIDSVPVILP